MTGDIHGNLPALDAVVRDARRRGAQALVSTGDVVGYGPWPQGCIDYLQELGIPVVQGNYDRGVGEGLPDCGCAYRTPREHVSGQLSLEWTSRTVSASGRDWLRGLPFALEIARPGEGPLAVVFHGSLRRVNEYLHADRPLRTLARLFEGEAAPVAVCGHTHIPYVRPLPGGRTLVNCGSAGRPRHGNPAASYALLHFAANGQEGPAGAAGRAFPQVQLIQVHYEAGRASAAVLASGLPDDFAATLRTGRGVES